MSLVELFYYFANKIFHRQEEEDSLRLPPAKETFKVVNIDRLNNWTRQKSASKIEPRENISCKPNYSFLQEFQGFSAKQKKEDYIKHLFNDQK